LYDVAGNDSRGLCFFSVAYLFFLLPVISDQADLHSGDARSIPSDEHACRFYPDDSIATSSATDFLHLSGSNSLKISNGALGGR